METKLKKITNENFRFYFLNFSEASGVWLDNNTRIKSFILDGQFEIAPDHWYELYVQIFNYLQRTRPHTIEHILEVPSLVTTRVELFLDYNGGNYIKTECGVYIKRFSNINKIIQVIRRLLQMYYVNPNDAYLVVEVPPKYEGEESDTIIQHEKDKLRKYLCSEYISGLAYYDKAVAVIEELNKLIKTFSPTSYNDLYLLNSLEDYRNYSHKILNNFLYFNKGTTFTERDFAIVVEWLECARFFDGDIFRTKPIAIGESFIEYEDKVIPVTMKTHFINDDLATTEVKE